MVYATTGYTIATNGQTLVIAAPTVGGATAKVYTTAACTVEHTFPQTITSDTTYYVDPTGTLGRYLVSATQPDGTELWGQKVDCFAGDGIKTIAPLPTTAQLAADTGAVNYFASQAYSSAVETIPRLLASTVVTLTSQTMRLSYFTAPKTFSVTSMKVMTGSTGAGATPTVVRFGIYSVAADGALTLVASTANDTTLLPSTNTIYTKDLSSPYTLVGGTRYAAAALVVTGATAPTIWSVTPAAGPLTALSPKLCSTLTGQSDLPAGPVADASLAASASDPWIAMV